MQTNELEYLTRVELREGRRFAQFHYAGPEGPTPQNSGSCCRR